MRIRITRRADASSTLVCVRADGNECWQKHEKRQAAHFPFHDLTHYAVETTLGTQRAFFGLVAAGWEFDDTTGKGARGAIPPEAIVVEHLVGLLDVERASHARWEADYIVEQLHVAGVPLDDTMRRSLTEATLTAIRARRDALFARWQAVPASGTLEVTFPLPLPE